MMKDSKALIIACWSDVRGKNEAMILFARTSVSSATGLDHESTKFMCSSLRWAVVDLYKLILSAILVAFHLYKNDQDNER